MWNGKKKAVTFSYDDGVMQDIRLIEIFNRYGLRATFNLNSGLLGGKNTLIRGGVQVRHDKIRMEDVRAVYDGHEVAAHTLTHPALCTLPDEEVVRQVEEDRQALSALVGYEVVGMAYPGGGVNHDARVEVLCGSIPVFAMPEPSMQTAASGFGTTLSHSRRRYIIWIWIKCLRSARNSSLPRRTHRSFSIFGDIHMNLTHGAFGRPLRLSAGGSAGMRMSFTARTGRCCCAESAHERRYGMRLSVSKRIFGEKIRFLLLFRLVVL